MVTGHKSCRCCCDPTAWHLQQQSTWLRIGRIGHVVSIPCPQYCLGAKFGFFSVLCVFFVSGRLPTDEQQSVKDTQCFHSVVCS